MKKTAITFWITTVIIFLFEGVVPALSSYTEFAKEGIRHLGYPPYFGTMLMLFKVSGALALIIPQVPSRIKEWAYAGFGFNFVAASISHGVIDGMGSFLTFFPLIFLALLILSYRAYHKRLKFTGNLASKKRLEQFNKEFVTA